MTLLALLTALIRRQRSARSVPEPRATTRREREAIAARSRAWRVAAITLVALAALGAVAGSHLVSPRHDPFTPRELS